MTDSTPDSNKIERDLVQTRARLDATIDALQQKLSPNEIVDQALTYFKESGGGEFGRNLMDTVRSNPLPVALVGIGVAWLMVSTTRGGTVQTREQYDEARARYRDDTTPALHPAPLLKGSPAIHQQTPVHEAAAVDGRVHPEHAHQPHERWEGEYLSTQGAYSSAALEDLATKAHAAGQGLSRLGDEGEDEFQQRVDAARGGVLGLRRDEAETHGGFRERVEAAVRAAAERYRALRGGSGQMNDDNAGQRQTAMQNLTGYGRSAAASTYDYGRQAAEAAYGYGQSALESGGDLGMGIVRNVRDNPLPYALVGAGIAWLLWSSSRSDSPAYNSAPSRYPAPQRPPYGGYNRGGTYGGSAGYDVRDAGSGATGAGYGQGGAGYGQGGAGYGQGAGVGYGRSGSIHDYAGSRVEDLAGRAHAAGSSLQRTADEDEDTFMGRVYAARGSVLGVVQDAGEALGSFRERVDAALGSAAEQFRRWRDQATDMGTDMAGRGQGAAQGIYSYGRSTGSDALSYLQAQPLLIGAIGVTVGAVLAMLLPASRYERELAGTVRGDVRERFRDFADDALESAGRVASEVMGTARDAADREGIADLGVGGVAQAARGRIHEAAERVRHVVEETAQAGREAVERELNGGDKDDNGSNQGRNEAAAQGGSHAGTAGRDDRRTPA